MLIKVKSGHRIENVPFVFTFSNVTLALLLFGLAVDISSHSKRPCDTRQLRAKGLLWTYNFDLRNTVVVEKFKTLRQRTRYHGQVMFEVFFTS